MISAKALKNPILQAIIQTILRKWPESSIFSYFDLFFSDLCVKPHK